MKPALPPGRPELFRATVHGTVFGARSEQVERLETGDPVLLIPDPPGEEDPAVWVHASTGDLVGHLPPEIGAWLAPWLLAGGIVTARALKVGSPEDPSWRRLLIEVRCETGDSPSISPHPQGGTPLADRTGENTRTEEG